jgi:hypothetical protein
LELRDSQARSLIFARVFVFNALRVVIHARVMY